VSDKERGHSPLTPVHVEKVSVPFYGSVFSEDHQDFISAKLLKPGSRLRTANGTEAVVESVERNPGRFEVFNLEVNNANQYHVSKLAILVHNAGANGIFGSAEYGQMMHDKFLKELIRQTGTRKSDWLMRTDPGLTGVDATYVGQGCRNPGFLYAELKPYSLSGYNRFLSQLDRWNLPAKTTTLWMYDAAGKIARTVGSW
jgi:hypothetical protein